MIRFHFADLAKSDFFALRSCHCIQTTTEVLAASAPHVQPSRQGVPQPGRRAARRPGTSGKTDATDPLPATLFFGALNREADWAPAACRP